MSFYMMLGLLSKQGLTLCDASFISQFGLNEISALSFAYPVINLFFFITYGIGTGYTVLVSRSFGKKDFHLLKRLTTDSMLFSMILYFLMSFIGILTIDPLFKLLGAPPALLPLIRSYMTIWYIGFPFAALPLNVNSVFRGMGDTKRPAFIHTLIAAVNIALDVILIFGLGGFLRMGLSGAAWAFLISNFLCFGWVLLLMSRTYQILVPLEGWKQIKQSWKELGFIAAPASVMNVIIPVASGVTTKILSQSGHTIVAAYGISSQIEVFSFIGIIAICTSVSSMVGQYLGAGMPEKARQSLLFSYVLIAFLGIFSAVILGVFSRPILTFFTDSIEVTEAATLYLSIIPSSYLFLGMLYATMNALNASKKPLLSLGLSLMRIFCIQMPFSLLFYSQWGALGVFVSICLAHILSSLLSLGVAHHVFHLFPSIPVFKRSTQVSS